MGPSTRASISAVPSIQGLRIMSGRTLPKDLHGFLDPNDGVAISFWIISIAMVAATVFFLMESTAVAGHWPTSMNVGALVTLVAAVHYRYIDWTITVPLQMIEFYLILSAVSKDISQASFWKLLIGTIVMLVAGYAGEANMLDPWIGFIVGCSGWGYILFEIFAGEAGQVAKKLSEANPHVVKSFGTMRIIVTAGWCIYPAGYFYGYLLGGVDDNSLNCIYNLADFVNKIGFCLAIWQSAKESTNAEKGRH